MSLVLCFQADLPMHAEVTNTFVPNVCLNPCRMCALHISNMQEKRKQQYVQSFLHIDKSGDHVRAPHCFEYVCHLGLTLHYSAQYRVATGKISKRTRMSYGRLGKTGSSPTSKMQRN
jgi:hypothetical protein